MYIHIHVLMYAHIHLRCKRLKSYVDGRKVWNDITRLSTCIFTSMLKLFYTPLKIWQKRARYAEKIDKDSSRLGATEDIKKLEDYLFNKGNTSHFIISYSSIYIHVHHHSSSFIHIHRYSFTFIITLSFKCVYTLTKELKLATNGLSSLAFETECYFSFQPS